MKKNRELLHKLLVKDSRIKPEYSDFDAFESHYFDSENNVKKIYDVIIVAKYKTGPKKGQVYYTNTLQKFYNDYVCDLNWAKKTNYCVVEKKPFTPEQKTISTTQQQQNLVDKGYFIGITGPNKNGVDGTPNKNTKEAQHALDSGIDAVTYNTIYKEKHPESVADIERIFGKQEPKRISNNTETEIQKTKVTPLTQSKVDQKPQEKTQVKINRVIKTINPNNW